MLTNHEHAPSAWVQRFLPLIRHDGKALDLAAGGGRHTRLLIDMGFQVTAVDRKVEALLALAGSHYAVHEIDLEGGAAWLPGGGYDAIIVTNYLYRPLFPAIRQALAAQGMLIYETFAAGNERLGRPGNPDFLLQPGELLEAFAGLTVIAFEQGEVSVPRPAVIQRIAAINGPLGRLPEPAALDNRC